MNTLLIYTLGLATLLAGCASDPLAQQKQATKMMEYKLQIYGPACEKLGFAKDTNEWRECIQREYEQVIIRQQYQLDNFYWNQFYTRPYHRHH
jgi:hypothetical protein